MIFKVLIRTSESPFKIILSIPISTISSSALLAAKASTLKTKKSKGINYDSEAITKPVEFLMITSSLAQLSFSKILA